MPYPDIVASHSDISVPIMSIHRYNVVCMLDRYEIMLTLTEFAAKSNGFRPQEDLTFALKTGYVIVIYPLIIKRVAQSASWREQVIITSFICYVNTGHNTILEEKSFKQY